MYTIILIKLQKKKNSAERLLKINQKQIKIYKVKDNTLFLYKSLKDFFSDDISTKYKKYYLDHNKTLIEKLLNEENEDNKKFFEKLFNLTPLDCLKHFRNEENIEELEGLEKLDASCEKFKKKNDSEKYIEIFHYYVKNFEKIIQIKKEREPKHSKKKNNF